MQGAIDLATLAIRAPNAMVITNSDDLTARYKGFDLQAQVGLGLQANLTSNLNLNFLFTAPLTVSFYLLSYILWKLVILDKNKEYFYYF